MLLALVLLAATTITSIPVYKSYSLPPETETYVVPVQKDSFLKQGSAKHNEGANPILDLQ